MTLHEYNFETFAGFHNDLTSIERLIAGQPLALSTSAFYSNSEQRTTFIWLRQVADFRSNRSSCCSRSPQGRHGMHSVGRGGCEEYFVICIFSACADEAAFLLFHFMFVFSLFRFIEQNIDMKIGFRFSCDRATNCASQRSRSFSCSCSTKRD